ncbi:MAG: FHA domain-containing protein [Pseudomonadota bacterium]
MYLEDEAIPLENGMTLGNHLDNDVIVPGEDVLDYHIRVELSGRGPTFIPLGAATFNVNGSETSGPANLILADVISIGQTTIQIGVEIESASETQAWSFEASHGNVRHTISGEVSVGRSDSQDIVLRDEHISRNHARLIEKHGYVWLQDLHSANGCYVNGDRIKGGIRLFHGDYIRFDSIEFQLVGDGVELTPIKHFSDALVPTARSVPQFRQDTTEVAPIADEAFNPRADVSSIQGAGAFLLAASEDLDQEIYQLLVGESTIGRGAHNQIIVSDSTVSTSHARLSVQPEGVTLTNLLATNGTLVNGDSISSVRLEDGDKIQLGRACFIFKDIPTGSVDAHPVFRRVQRYILVGLFVAAALLLWLTT